ncbi:MAG: hypothetical protein ACYS4W_05805 [Planctomycetota bacterium]
MGRKKYFIISVVLAVCAISLDSVAKGYYSRSALVIAKAVAAKGDAARARAESSGLLRRGRIFQYTGVGCAVLGFLSWLRPEVHRRPGWRVIPLVLLIFYLLLQLVIV